MKKIILGILAIGSLSFAQENYEVSKNNGYQMEQINKLNPEIEKAVSKFYTFENLEILFEKEYEKMSKNEREFYSKLLFDLYKHLSYKIKKVSYVSENNIKVFLEVKYPNMNVGAKTFIKELDEVFKEKTGQNYYDYTHKGVLQEKTITDAYEKLFYDCLLETLQKIISKAKVSDYETNEVELQGIKENGEWKIIISD